MAEDRRQRRVLRWGVWLAACSLLLTAWGAVPAFCDEGNIDTTNKYAWGENSGWQNWRPTHGGATVTTTGVYGYIWLENVGWIKLAYDSNPPYENTSNTDWGVNNDGSGNLSGYAWSENAGWINFHPTHSQVTINTSTGEFDGYGWSENLGWVHFKKASPAYNVQTTADLTGPTLDSITWTDVDNSTNISATDTLTFTFSEAMTTSTIDNAGGANDVDTVLAPSSGNYGTSGASGISWTNSTTLVVTLGTGCTVASGATVEPTSAVKDAAGNSDNTTAPGPSISDNVGPSLNSIKWSDVDSSNTLSENDTLTFTFSEAMDTTTINNSGGANDVDTVLAPSSGNYGSSGAKSVSWTNSTTLVVTLGASPTISRNATVNPTSAVKDAAGNGDSTTSNSGNGPGFVNPYGVVFDAVSNNPIQGATVTIYTSSGVQCTPGSQIASTDTNPQTTSATGEYSFLCNNGDYYITISATGYNYPSTKSSFSAGRTITTGSKGETFTVSGTVLHIDQPLDSSSALLKVSKDANKKEVAIGDVVTYTVTIQNTTASAVTSVYLEDKIPAGFKYISGKAILDNAAIFDPTGNRPLTFNIGTVSGDTTKTLKYQLVVGSGVTFGNYENTAFAKYSDGTVISNNATETVKVVPDPLFDLGTTIGKVFHDRNENGIQDQGEEPIPNVQIATEEGTLITTDKDGKFHLPAIIPGRHLFRLDERTLPQGAYLTTDKVVIVDITPGILAKVNFGINWQDKGRITEAGGKTGEVKERITPVSITQDRNKPNSRLNVSLFKDELIIKDDKLIKPAEFRIFTNYSLFIDKWKLEILDKDTLALIKSFTGTSLSLNEPIIWDGLDKSGKLVRADRNYVYILTVTGKDGRQDVTKEKKLSVVSSQLSEEEIAKQKSEKEIEKEKQEWCFKESKVNNLEKQNIRIEGETINIKYQKSNIKNVKILKSGNLEAEIPAVQQEGLTAKELLEKPQIEKEKEFEQGVDIIIPKGEYDIQVMSQGSEAGIQKTEVRSQTTEGRSQASEDGENRTSDIRPLTSEIYTQHIKVDEDYLFFVGMGDAKMGYTINRGNIEPTASDDKFREGFWAEGKAAYYLKGKIKGKYLITSSLDTQRDKKELFRNLDPNKYYPVYGDSSSVNYDATNTQGPLYLLIEWDKSSVIWGNYNTSFTETEFAQFSRTLYGGKLHYENISTTQFGEPKTKLIVFRARAKQKAAHNEFIGTGGSLFYLKNKDVIEGSDKVKIEVRDKITGLVLATKQLESRVDYQINYSEGRLIFWKPISQISESDSIISTQLLAGNPVYVVVDYEYETKDKYDEGNYGIRAQQSLTDYLRVGGTYVKEEQLDKNYILKGTDTVIHLGKDVKLTAEFAESESESLGSFISTDGGLSFTELATANATSGKAYGLKGEAQAFGRLGLTGYYKQIEKGFSSASTISRQGKELIGAGATLDITPKTRLKVSHDIQKLIDDGNPQTQLQVGAKKTATTSVQLQHEVVTDKLKLTGEYRRQQVTEKKEQFESETNTEEDVVAVKADYQATKKTSLSLEQQATLKGTPNQQTTLGVVNKPADWLSLRGKETVGNQGTATSVGASAHVKEKFELSGDITRANARTGETSDTVSVGGKAKLDDKTQVHTTIAVTDSASGGQTQSLVFGTEKKLNEELKLVSSKTYAKNQDKLTQANTYGLTKEKDGKKLEGTLTTQASKDNTEVSNTNIFGLSGDINDKWAAQGSFERGIVQNHDGTQATRNAGSIGLGFVDKDKQTQEVRLKASSKIELRQDFGQENKRQYLVYNAVEGKINPNTTLFAKANVAQTKNTTTKSSEAEYKELSTGVAYRPVNFDRLNLLGKYTYLEDYSPSGQTDISDIEKEKSHTLAGEAVYDLTDKWQLVEKLAYKMGEEKVSGFEFTKTQTWLMVHRLNYNLYKDWQVGGEYRRLTQKQAKDYKQGVLVEVARKVGEFIQVGVGYNFTNFNDDLTHLNYTAQGPFVRLTGKFYDRTPEEIERARQIWLERMIKLWTQQLVNEELARPGSKIMQELYKYFYLAEKLQAEGKLKESAELYEKILQIGNIMYQEAEVYVRDRIELEKSIQEKNRLALAYYKEGKLQEAKALWERILKEAEPKPITLEVIR